jgi:hypothetical protein
VLELLLLELADAIDWGAFLHAKLDAFLVDNQIKAEDIAQLGANIQNC